VPENAKKIVLADTNVLLEAHRTGCLKALCAQHSIVTVSKCIEETQTGFHLRPPEDTISREFLLSSLSKIAEVSKIELATLELRLPSGPYLDEGEKHLLAYALTRSDSYLLCGPDRAMIRAAAKLNLIERLISLGQLAAEANIGNRQIKLLSENFGKRWLEDERAKAVFGIL
jgi:hypothetical protein